MSVAQIYFPDKLAKLLAIPFGSVRYRVMYGGRGSGKSFAAAKMAAIYGYSKTMRILCTREFQASISQSFYAEVKKAIMSEQFLKEFYDVGTNYIRGKNGTEFLFAGLRKSISSVKSMSDISLCIVEEAEDVPDASWRDLIPSIRADNSEIWVVFNPRLEESATYTRFITNADENMALAFVNYNDNKFFPPVLDLERIRDKKNLSDAMYNHIWNGACLPSIEGAIYQNEFEFLEATNRIITLDYTPDLPVNTYWDLGRRDATAIWFAQHAIGEEHRFIDYYENTGKDLGHYSEIVLNKGYNLGEHYLPHDVQVTELSTGISRIDTLYKHGLKNITTVPRVREIETGIEATRQILKQCWFDKERCKQGLHALKSYQYEYDDKLKCYKRDKPLHNWASNGCLVGNSIIETANGKKKIADISIGEFVVTPNGNAKVINAGVTKVSTELLMITLSNGQKLICTPEHKIFTIRGVVYADELRHNDAIITNCGEKLWRQSSASKKQMGYRDAFIESSKVRSIGGGTIEISTLHKRISSLGYCIVSYGRSITELTRKGLNLLTEIGKISTLVTGNYPSLKEYHLKLRTRFKNLMEKDISEEKTDIFSIKKEINYCIGQYGSFLTEKYQKITTFTTKTKIKVIIQLIILSCYQRQNTANTTLKIMSGLAQKQTKINFVKLERNQQNGTQAQMGLNGTQSTEKRHGKAESMLVSRALSAIQNLKHHIQREQNSVVVVASIKREKTQVPVYDLTVEHEHCYFANGILVSNSDAFRQFAQAYQLPTNDNVPLDDLTPMDWWEY